jgi:hypothetical protein
MSDRFQAYYSQRTANIARKVPNAIERIFLRLDRLDRRDRLEYIDNYLSNLIKLN